MFLKPVVIGNWKMHKTAKEASAFIQGIKKAGTLSSPIYLSVPYTSIAACSEVAKNLIVIGAQNFYPMPQGAYTGEISAQMLKEAGARFVLVGHSERRRLFGETNDFIREKVHYALKEGLTPVVCVGETLEERKVLGAEETIKRQILGSLNGMTAAQFSSILIAYEPAWAIGTGVSAPLEAIESMHSVIRKIIFDSWGSQAAVALNILYGGSVNEQNAAILLNISNVDGLLVGGASLEVQKFATLLSNINILTEKGKG